MDTIDTALINALHNLLARMAASEPLRTARLKRRQRTLARPVRPFCLCLRAADTRIRHEIIGFFDENFAAEFRPHTLWLTGQDIRDLTAPVHIPWPGIPLRHAAKKLGRHPNGLNPWVRHATLQLNHEPARPYGYTGKPQPIIHAPGPIDPGSDLGRPFDPLFKVAWLRHFKRIPPSYQVELQREPVFTPQPRGQTFTGWRFTCPGLPVPRGCHAFARLSHKHASEKDTPPSCGRRVTKLYCPIAPFTAVHLLANPDPRHWRSKIDAILGHIAQLSHPVAGPTHFACRHCWNIHYTPFAHPGERWNQFITHLSAGLLLGREVPMPPEIRLAPARRYARRPRINRPPSQRRQQVLQLLLAGLPYKQISRLLKIKITTIEGHAGEIYRQHGVHTRAKLAEKLGRSLPTPNGITWQDSPHKTTPIDPHIQERRAQVAQLKAKGLPRKAIAEKLNINLQTVYKDLQHAALECGVTTPL